MKKVIAREDLCLDCKLCEVFCRTAHSESKDVVRAHLREDPVPFPASPWRATHTILSRSTAATVMTPPV